MFDFERYSKNCSKILMLVKKGRGGIYLGAYDVLGGTIYGQQIIADSRHLLSIKMLYVPPPVEASVLALLHELIKPGMLCVDVDAGCGYYSVILASLANSSGHIHSFEAVPDCFKLIQKNIELNDLDNVTPVNKLVSNELTTENITYFGGNYEFFFLTAKENQERSAEIETATLDHYFSNTHLPVDFVKINSEDRLAQILKGMKDLITFNRDIKILCRFNIEKFKKESDVTEFFSELNRHDFKIFILPTLASIEKEELCLFKTTKHILLSKSN